MLRPKLKYELTMDSLHSNCSRMYSLSQLPTVVNNLTPFSIPSKIQRITYTPLITINRCLGY